MTTVVRDQADRPLPPAPPRVDDLGPTHPFKELEWDLEHAQASLQAVFREITRAAEETAVWYVGAKKWKRFWARFARGVAIFLAASAGILPMVAQVVPDTSWIQPVYASILLALAGALVMLDRFFGFSSAWIRFISTELELRRALEEFRLEWEIERASWGGNRLDHQQVQKALDRCRAFISRVNGIVREETNLWIAEFQDNLRQLDEAVRAKAATASGGAANVVLSNADECDPSGWFLTVDGGPEREGAGRTAAIANLAPAIHVVAVRATKNGVAIHGEKSFPVTGGMITDVEVTLS